jgi:hypothetical protein
LRCRLWSIAGALLWSAVSSAQVSVTYIDQIGDQKLRRFDAGADDPISPTSVLPDLSAVHIAGWAPSGPGLSAFAGQQKEVRDADVVKIEVIFEGLLNPPGPLGLGLTSFDPYRYGPSPVYGFVDFDADENKDTGGELTLPAQLRYLANVARFGHIPDNSIGGRAATRGKQVDGSYQSQPFYERSGADFAIALCGCWDIEIVDEGMNPNGVFEAGETWFIRGRFFERARGYAGASSVVGGSAGGQYDPVTTVRWLHDVASNRTVLTLVEALNMDGAATLRGEPKQSPDFSLFNHTSVEEAVADLIFNHNSGSGLTALLIEDWEGREPEDALRATRWETTVLIGTSHTSPFGTLYAWTDTGFEETPGDVNGNGSANAQDEDELRSFVYANDGGPDDEDGVKNGVFDIKNFGPNFVIFDLDYNGLVEGEDLWLYGHRADLDDNGLLDLFDILIFQDLFVNGDLAADFDLNERLEIFDFLAFQDALSR